MASRLWKQLRNWFGKPHDVSNVLLTLRDPDSRGAATGAVIAHVLSRPDSIRQRAQNAATISGALAVALVAAAITGLTGEDESFQDLTIGLVCGAIISFAISTLLSVYAVVFPHPMMGNRGYRRLIKEYEGYADEVRQKMRWAATATGLALALTAGAVVVEIFERASTDSTPMSLVLTPQAMSAVERLCWDGRKMTDDRTVAPQISGDLREDELSKAIVEVKNIAGEDVRRARSTDRGRVNRGRRGRGGAGGRITTVRALRDQHCSVKLPRKSIRAATPIQ